MQTQRLISMLLIVLVYSNMKPVLCQEAAIEPSRSSNEVITDWIRTGKSRYDWSWLQGRFDANQDERIAETELPARTEVFQRIDRNWDGVLTSADFDWSKESVLGRQKETAFALFKSADRDSNGRISATEWQQLFAKHADEIDYLSEEQLETLMFRARVRKSAKEEGLRTSDSEYSPANLAARPVPQPGDEAPDFTLSSPELSRRVSLSQYRGKKPVVLVFGCYTCGNYRTYSESLEQMYQFWGNEVEFLRVYVREAHPTSNIKSATATNQLAGILIEQPVSLEERCKVATSFAAAMKITTPMVVDEMDNEVGQDYGAWPDRLYIVDGNGKIAFTGGPGPFGFNPREMEQSLAMLLMDQPPSSLSKEP